jgi:outer membrane protein assembly factor BamD (BamD/ComL family)
LTHNRLSKQDIKEDDFVTAVLRAREFIYTHQNAFFVGLAALVIIIAGTLWMSNSRSTTRESAATQFAEALASFRSGDIKTAEEMFKIIDDRFSGFEQGAYAAYMAGKCALEDGRNTQAIEMFESYLSRSGKHPFFHDAALDGLATAWENEGNFDMASKTYMQLADDMKTNSFVEASYLRKAADALKMSNRRERAIEVLERLHEISSGMEKRDIEIEIEILRG